MNIYDWLANLGFPAAILMFLVYSALKAAKFIAPLVRSLTEKHCELVDTLKSQTCIQTELLRAQNKVLEQHGQLLDQIHSAIRSIP